MFKGNKRAMRGDGTWGDWRYCYLQILNTIGQGSRLFCLDCSVNGLMQVQKRKERIESRDVLLIYWTDFVAQPL